MKLMLKNKSFEMELQTDTAEDCVTILRKGVLCLFQLDEDILEDLEFEEEEEELEEEAEAYHQEVKRLVFTKCDQCGEVICKMVDLESTPTIECKCGRHLYISESKLYHGGYECDCHARGSFLMTSNVDKVKCVKCRKNLYMVKDTNSNSYRGTSF